jgi:hypothetical protein
MLHWKTLFKVKFPLLITLTGNESLTLVNACSACGAHLHQVDYSLRAMSIILSLFNSIHRARCADIKGNTKNTNIKRRLFKYITAASIFLYK